MDNPLFTTGDGKDDKGYVLPPKRDPVSPSAGGWSPDGSSQAAEVIRAKLNKIYADEPDAKTELTEAETVPKRSKHQQFMHELSTSGKDLAAVQTEWHNYYVSLPPEEKKQVWQEFYESNKQTSQYEHSKVTVPPPGGQLAAHKNDMAGAKKGRGKRAGVHDARTPAELRAAIRSKVSAGGKLKTKHHLQSLMFGVGLGFLAVFIFMFTFFNDRFLAPFIQPGRSSAAAVIIDPGSVAPTPNPEVIIPKINVEIPVDYSQTTTDESQIEDALNSGVVHYPTTSLPGQNGNTAFFGHSSNNIFNPGKYKFAFVLLHTLVPGDVFYLTKDSKVYAYKVFSKTVVDPSEVGVLDPVGGHSATATLITCDPPGTSLKRLIVVGDQISPDPGGNSAATVSNTTTSTGSFLPGNGPSLWMRWWSTAYGKTVTFLFVAAFLVVFWRRLLASGQPA